MNRRTPATLLYRYFQLKPTFIIGIWFDFCIFTTPLALHTRSILLDAAPILLAPNIRYCLTATPRTAESMRPDQTKSVNMFFKYIRTFDCPVNLFVFLWSTKLTNQLVGNVNDELYPDQGFSGRRRPLRSIVGSHIRV